MSGSTETTKLVAFGERGDHSAVRLREASSIPCLGAPRSNTTAQRNSYHRETWPNCRASVEHNWKVTTISQKKIPKKWVFAPENYWIAIKNKNGLWETKSFIIYSLSTWKQQHSIWGQGPCSLQGGYDDLGILAEEPSGLFIVPLDRVMKSFTQAPHHIQKLNCCFSRKY